MQNNNNNNNNNEKKYYSDSIPLEQRTNADPRAKQYGQSLVDKFEEEKARGKTVEDIKSNNILNEELNELEMYNRSSHNTTQLRMYGSERNNTVMVAFVDRQGNVADEIVSSDTPSHINDREEYHDDMEPLSGSTSIGQAHFEQSESPDSALGESGGEEYVSPSSHMSSVRSHDGIVSGSISDSGVESESTSGSESESTSGSEGELASEPAAGVASELNPIQEVLQENSNSNKDETTSEQSNKEGEKITPKVEESASSHKRKRDDDSDEDNTGAGPSKRVELEDLLMDQGSDIYDLSGE